jgi:hypothetical protein
MFQAWTHHSLCLVIHRFEPLERRCRLVVRRSFTLENESRLLQRVLPKVERSQRARSPVLRVVLYPPLALADSASLVVKLEIEVRLLD